MRGQWIFTLLILGIGTIVLIHTGTGVPSPANATNASSGVSKETMRMTAKLGQSSHPNTGETWLLTQDKPGRYLATLYVDGRERKILATRGKVNEAKNGTVYQTAGIVQFGKVTYHATQIFVPNSNSTKGYIQFVRNES